MTTLAAAHADLSLVIALIAVLFLLGALYVGIQLGQWFGAVALVVCAILIFAFLA